MDVSVNDVPVINPSELPQRGMYSRNRGSCNLYKMSTNVGDEGYVWTDTYEDAFEEWVEHLDTASPGVFETLTEDDLKEAAADLGYEWEDSWPDFNDPTFNEVQGHAEADLDHIGHTTLNSGTHIPKDAWNQHEIERGSDEYNQVWCACAKAFFEENDEWPDKPQYVEDCPEMKGWPLVDDLDGVPSKRSVPAWIRR